MYHRSIQHNPTQSNPLILFITRHTRHNLICTSLSFTSLALGYETLLLVDGKHILRLQHIRLVARPKDLLLLTLPLRVVNPVDPVLDLHNDAPVFLYDARAALVALGRLDRERS